MVIRFTYAKRLYLVFASQSYSILTFRNKYICCYSLVYMPKGMELGLLVSPPPSTPSLGVGGGVVVLGGKFSNPSVHAFVQWTLTLTHSFVTITEWLLYSFSHSCIRSVNTDFDSLIRYHEGMVAVFIHPFSHSCIRSVNTGFDSLIRFHDRMVAVFIHPFSHSCIRSVNTDVRTVQGFTMAEWLLDSFSHSFTHAFVQWTLTLQGTC